MTTTSAAGAIPEPLDLPATDSDEPQDWYFTFGSGHHIYVGHSPETIGPGKGIDVMGYYVVIYGTHDDARARMYEYFGAAWSSQYSELPDIGVTWKHLIDIPELEENRLS